jgi:TDG/mug DNA glycosylase family protein
MAVLPNVLARHLDVVFCGTAVGKRSAELGAYYAGPGNKFWPTLHRIRLTPYRLEPAEYRKLLRWRLGLTDLAKHVSGADSTLRRKDFSAEALRALIAKYQPRYVAFTGKRAAREFFGSEIEYGLHQSQLGTTRFFVLSSPSGLASRFWKKGRHWHELAALIRELPPNKSLERSRDR